MCVCSWYAGCECLPYNADSMAAGKLSNLREWWVTHIHPGIDYHMISYTVLNMKCIISWVISSYACIPRSVVQKFCNLCEVCSLQLQDEGANTYVYLDGFCSLIFLCMPARHIILCECRCVTEIMYIAAATTVPSEAALSLRKHRINTLRANSVSPSHSMKRSRMTWCVRFDSLSPSLRKDSINSLRANSVSPSPSPLKCIGLIECLTPHSKSMLQKAASTGGKNWDELLPYLLCTYLHTIKHLRLQPASRPSSCSIIVRFEVPWTILGSQPQELKTAMNTH